MDHSSLMREMALDRAYKELQLTHRMANHKRLQMAKLRDKLAAAQTELDSLAERENDARAHIERLNQA